MGAGKAEERIRLNVSWHERITIWDNSLQSFSVPGSMWLSILGGALFNFWLTLFTVSLVNIYYKEPLIDKVAHA